VAENLDESGISGEIFGKRGGHIHGFLSVAEQWTDNLFYTPDDTQSDWVTIVSPGIRLSIPGTKEALLSIDGSTTAPGGSSFGRRVVGTERRFQAYLSYSPEFEFYADNADENIETHLANGLVAWRLRSGLALELIDQFSIGYQDFNVGVSQSRDEYYSNLAGFNVLYPVGGKLALRFNFQKYQITYDEDEEADRDRTDNSLSGYALFHVLPKSSVYIRYRWTDIDYDTAGGAMDDSHEQQWTSGFRWEMTAKSEGDVQVGYSCRAFDNPSLRDISDIVLEAQIDHQFTAKTSAFLRAYRRQEETSIETTDYTLSNFAGLGLSQQVTYRIQFELSLDYLQDDYKGGRVVNGVLSQRDDQTYAVTTGLSYAPRGWLSFGLDYGYERRESNFDAFEYTNNRVMLQVTGAI
jgi:hypothetical protein